MVPVSASKNKGKMGGIHGVSPESGKSEIRLEPVVSGH